MFLSEIEGLYENSRGEKKKVKKKERKREGDKEDAFARRGRGSHPRKPGLVLEHEREERRKKITTHIRQLWRMSDACEL